LGSHSLADIDERRQQRDDVDERFRVRQRDEDAFAEWLLRRCRAGRKVRADILACMADRPSAKPGEIKRAADCEYAKAQWKCGRQGAQTEPRELPPDDVARCMPARPAAPLRQPRRTV